jgi:hypothetical protein
VHAKYGEGPGLRVLAKAIRKIDPLKCITA